MALKSVTLISAGYIRSPETRRKTRRCVVVANISERRRLLGLLTTSVKMSDRSPLVETLLALTAGILNISDLLL